MPLSCPFVAVMNRIDPRAPDCSFKDFIARQKCDARTRRLLTGFVEGFDAAHTERIGVHGLLKAERSAEKMEGDAQARIDPVGVPVDPLGEPPQQGADRCAAQAARIARRRRRLVRRAPVWNFI